MSQSSRGQDVMTLSPEFGAPQTKADKDSAWQVDCPFKVFTLTSLCVLNETIWMAQQQWCLYLKRSTLCSCGLNYVLRVNVEDTPSKPPRTDWSDHCERAHVVRRALWSPCATQQQIPQHQTTWNTNTICTEITMLHVHVTAQQDARYGLES